MPPDDLKKAPTTLNPPTQSSEVNRDASSVFNAANNTSPYQSPQTYPLINQDRELSERGRFMVSYNHLTYLLYLLSYFTAGLLWIVPIAMNYLKRKEAEGTWLATHFDWQIKTFWYSIIFFILGTILTVFSLGGLGIAMFADSAHVAAGSFGLFTLGLIIIGLTVIWHLYRIIRGWIALADKRPVP